MDYSATMHGSYNPTLFVLSIVIAILSAYAALDLAGRIAFSRSGGARFIWLACGSIAMGIGIWAMHYIGMLAYRMSMPVLYDWPTVLLSMLAAVLASALALYAVSRPTMSLLTTCAGSLSMGSGIAAMHYIGMAAMRMPARAVYSLPIVDISILAAVIIAFAALRLTFANRHIKESWTWRKSISAVLMGLAIPVLHYLGMAAVTFVPAVSLPVNLRHAIDISDLGAASIALVSVVLLCLVYLSAFIDRRFSSHADELESNEARYRRIISAAFDAFVGIASDCTITDWNRQAEHTFGWTASEAIGKSVQEILCTSADSEANSLNFNRLASLGDTPLQVRVEVTARHKTGMLFPAEMAISEFSSDGNRMFAAFVHDVTERKLASRSMEEARASAESANRAKSEFLANMSHEIRTPLNGVIGMTDLTLETELSRDQREYLETVKFSADSLLTVINDILDFSKIEAGKVDLELIRFDLRECIETTLKTLALRADEKGIELLCDISQDVAEVVLGDSTRLRQILVNIVGNAIKFTASGEVSLQVNNAAAAEGEDQVHFTVSDTGIGIAESKIDTIFDSFSQADTSTTRQYGGTGLGLTICKRLIKLMGGRIWIESTLGKGSTFHFVVPFPLVPQLEPIPIVSPAAELLRNVKVLVVDDNKTNRRILEGLLRLWGMNVSSVAEGEVALRMLTKANLVGEPFRLLLTDMHMPKMDGFMLLQEIQSNSALTVPTVMMLSSGGHHGDASRCQRLGVAAYLLKPVRKHELQESIARALGVRATMAGPSTIITQTFLQPMRPVQRTLNILLAEDNEVNQKLAVRMLQKRGHTVTVAANGREALEAVERNRYDLVLMDVQMPEMDGIEATLKIRAWESGSDRHQPIVAMTALVMKGDRERCLNAEMDGYLSKPIRTQELDAVLDAYTAKKVGDMRRNQSKENARSRETGASVNSAELLERIDGDREFVAEFAVSFGDDCLEKMNMIRECIESGDAERLRRVAHGLKGALVNLAATRAAELASQLERICSAGELGRTLPIFKELEIELPLVMQDLERICNEPVL